MNFRLKIRKVVTVITAAAFYLTSVPVQAAGLPPMSLSQMYSYAAQGNVRALRTAVQRGLNIDSVDRRGNTGLCHSILQNNYTAYNAFRSSGANPRHPCIQNIPPYQYESFMDSSRAAAITDSPRQAYNKFAEGEFIIAKRTWIIGGLLLGGGIALLLSGGGGGGGGGHYFVPYSEPDDSLAKFVGTKNPTQPENRPYQAVKYSAFDEQTVVNKKNGSETNDFSISNNSSTSIYNKETGAYEDKKLVDIIDLNGNILEYTAYLQVGMKARNNSTVENGTAYDGSDVPMITLGDATAGLVADDRSMATNYGTIKTVAQNGTISMIAGNHSVATNEGEINMAFKGIKDSDSVIGMYADTYSSIVNNGNITGNTIDSGTGGGSGGTGDATNPAGTIIGMEVRTVNEVPYPASTPVATASNNGNITLSATADTNPIGTSLVGMGGYLDKDFLDGTKLIRRASGLYLNNLGEINLTYTLTGTGTYESTTNTLLNGMGGIIGMRSDAKTNAINEGDINILVTSGVNNAATGMLSVHGGIITNEGNINVTGGEGNYGMLSVRGKGSNAEIDALTPTLTNNGNIKVTSTNGYGMASYNGGKVTNNGDITMVNVGTGMRTNTGILDNKNTITLQNSGQGMVIKSNDTASTGDGSGDGAGSGGDGSSGAGDGSSGTGDDSGTGTTTKEDLSRAQAINNGLITINNADNAQGIFIEDGTAVNNGTGIKITNTSRVPAASSYGIKAEKGSVENNSLIDMNVLVSTDGSTAVDSYGIYSDSANINNTVNGKIVFHKRGTGIATTSGRVTNLGEITMNQGGTGISSDSGDIYNNGKITIDDNDTAASTGISSNAGKIANNGNIVITGGNGATGIKAGLLVDNNSDIDLTGRNITGIELTGADATANNYADINIISTGLSADGKFSYGMKAGASAVNATLKNYNDIILTGTTNLTNQEQGYGIYLADGSAYNYGSITFNNMYGWGMYTTAGTIINDATILMGSGGYGMYGSGTQSQLTNNGTGRITITVPKDDDKSDSYGMYATDGATAINKGLITITSNNNPSLMLSKAYGIYVDNGNASNQGTITLNGSNSTGIAYEGSNAGDTIKNDASGVINLDGNTLIGMSASGGTAINAGIINVGTDTTASTAPNSIGMKTTGGKVINQNLVNVNSINSVGLQSDNDAGEITNNGIINISSSAINSYAFLSNAGTAINGISGRVNINISDTDIMRATGGNVINQGSLEIKNNLSNVNAMRVAGTGDATNDEGGLILVGTSAGATGTNNVGILVDGEGTATNKGVITVWSKNSYGMKSDNENSNLTNDGTINIMASATGSVALYSVSGNITNTKDAIINMYAAGAVMVTDNGTITNAGTINLTQAASVAMQVNDTGTAINSGTINVTGANSDALYAAGAGILQNTKVINISGANSNAMRAKDDVNATLSNSGTITINSGATGATALYNANGTSTNETSGIINILESGTTALYTKVGTLYNKGLINLSAANSIGIHVEGATGSGENAAGGIINVNTSGSRGLYVKGGGSITNNGTINMLANNSFGLYADGGTATNNADITIGDLVTGSYALYGVNGASLVNKAIIKLGISGGVGIYAQNSSVNNNGGQIIINSNISSSGIQVVNDTGGGNIYNSGKIDVTYSGNGSGVSAYGINVVSPRNITINNSGDIGVAANGSSGKAYGIYVSGAANITNASGADINVNADNAYGIYLAGSGTATNQGTITVTDNVAGNAYSYGMYASSGASLVNSGGTINVNSDRGVGMYISGSGTGSNTGSISVNDKGSGNTIYGIQTTGSGTLTNSGNITVTGSGSAYGMTGGGTLNNTSGTIEVRGGSNVFGMYSSGGSVTNGSSVTVNGSGTVYGLQGVGSVINNSTVSVSSTGGTAYGMIATSGNLNNNGGTITVNSTGTAYGMHITGGGSATNTGTINVTGGTAYGMYTTNGSLINRGTINMFGSNATGMYASGSTSSITNNGEITINGTSISNGYGSSSSDNLNPDPDNPSNCTSSGCGNYIKVSGGAKFTNNASVRSFSALNFNSMADDTGIIEIGKGGTYEAPEISGRIRASSNIVREGNAKTYVNEDSFVGEDEGIELNSGSYLFDAKLVKNADGNQDVVMTMKDFRDVVENQNIANFLANNYDLGARLDIYSELKSAATAAAFGSTTAEQLGLDLMPSFAKQNLDIVKSLDRHMSTTLFNNNDTKDLRAMINYAYDSRKQDGIDFLSGYEDEAHSIYGLFDRKYNNNFRYGFGVSLTKYTSDYDNGSSRDEVIAQVLAPLIYQDEGLKVLSMPRIGFGWGDYKRYAAAERFEADTKNIYYGITNEVRKEIAAGPITLEPTAEFNILGLHQGQTKEKGNLEVNSSNNVSVEGGIGLYAKKTFSIKEDDDLSLRVGGTYYHEFNNPYQAAKARIAGMAGSFTMDDYDTERDRAILSFRMDYKHDEFDFFFEANKYLERDDGYALNLGMGYRF